MHEKQEEEKETTPSGKYYGRSVGSILSDCIEGKDYANVHRKNTETQTSQLMDIINGDLEKLGFDEISIQSIQRLKATLHEKEQLLTEKEKLLTSLRDRLTALRLQLQTLKQVPT